jgi:hypothetical protein
MKRYIKSSSDFNSQLTEYVSFNQGRQKFSCHMVDADKLGDLDQFKATISEIHPYDEAPYIWAQIGALQPLQVRYIQKGKEVSTGRIPDYDDEMYETPYEYVDAVLDTVAVELQRLNKDIKPMMSHY